MGLEPEPKLWTKVDPELKIKKFGTATLPVSKTAGLGGQKIVASLIYIPK